MDYPILKLTSNNTFVVVHEYRYKDVPAGKPFKIVDISELLQDIPQEFWIIDDKDLTDGIGGESNEFN